MFAKKTKNSATPSIHPNYRFGIVLLAVLICAAIFGISLPGKAGMLSQASPGYAQSANSIFGVEANPLSELGGLNWITQTQTAFVRGPVVFWDEIEITEGTYNWGNLGDVVSELQTAEDQGLAPIVVVTGTPAWAPEIRWLHLRANRSG